MQTTQSGNDPLLLSARDVATLLQCSDKHIQNLRIAGRIPAPVKLGTLVRWPRQVIEQWIEAGCPAVAYTDTKQLRAS
jgi:excisionase family DNA binding protein